MKRLVMMMVAMVVLGASVGCGDSAPKSSGPPATPKDNVNMGPAKDKAPPVDGKK